MLILQCPNRVAKTKEAELSVSAVTAEVFFKTAGNRKAVSDVCPSKLNSMEATQCLTQKPTPRSSAKPRPATAECCLSLAQSLSRLASSCTSSLAAEPCRPARAAQAARPLSRSKPQQRQRLSPLLQHPLRNRQPLPHRLKLRPSPKSLSLSLPSPTGGCISAPALFTIAKDVCSSASVLFTFAGAPC
jgi:hypothetical protein